MPVAWDVLTPGFLTTVQDLKGRPQSARHGVASGGPLDRSSAELANRLLDNAASAALLELTLVGPSLRVTGGPTVVALTGADLGARLNQQPLATGLSTQVRDGSIISFGARVSGARAYLAVAGGLEVPCVLGSASTDLAGGFGGLDARALRAGDRLTSPAVTNLTWRSGRRASTPGWSTDRGAVIRVVAGPHREHFHPNALRRLCAEHWQVGASADRMGLRLLGPVIEHARGADVVSLGLPWGAIQVPGDGQPIVLLADHQPTGGYAVLACVIRADLDYLAHRVAGDAVRFVVCSLREARAVWTNRRQAAARSVIADAAMGALRLSEAHG